LCSSGGCIVKKENKKLRYTVHNKARVDGCIAEAFACKEITNFSSMFSHVPTMWYHVVRDVQLSELSIFQWKGIGVGATSAHYVTDKE
jgi:hypothetical protein